MQIYTAVARVLHRRSGGVKSLAGAQPDSTSCHGGHRGLLATGVEYPGARAGKALLLLNPQHVKALPGHKTDRVDAARITRRRTVFTTFFFRVSRKAGMKKAAVAVAHEILVLAYVMIRDGSQYQEQGPDYFDRIHPERTKNRLTARLERLGFDVSLKPKLSPQIT